MVLLDLGNLHQNTWDIAQRSVLLFSSVARNHNTISICKSHLSYLISANCIGNTITAPTTKSTTTSTCLCFWIIGKQILQNIEVNKKRGIYKSMNMWPTTWDLNKSMEYFLYRGQGLQSLFIKESGCLPSFTFHPENNFLKQLSGFFGRRKNDLPANTTFL